mgnify:CR=1 FL=1
MNKEKILGQFFTKESIIEKLLDILFEYKHYKNNSIYQMTNKEKVKENFVKEKFC